MKKEYLCPDCSKVYKTKFWYKHHVSLKHLQKSFISNIFYLLLVLIMLPIFFSAYDDKIKHYWDKFINNKEADVTFSLSEFVWLKNPGEHVKLSDVKREEGKKISLTCSDEGNEICLIYKNPNSEQYQFETREGNKMFGTLVSIHDYDSATSTKESETFCEFIIPVKLNVGIGETKNFGSHLPIDKAIQLRDDGCPFDGECTLHSYLVSNFGNKKMDDFKAKFCIDDGFIIAEEGDGLITEDSCIEIKDDVLLPEDSLSGEFYTKHHPENLTSYIEKMYIYDEYSGFSYEKNLIQTFNILVPNCS